jgi:hypothetical protein
MLTEMRISKYVLFSIVCIAAVACNEDEPHTVDPIVGEWKRNFYQFSNLPVTHKNYENLILPTPYAVASTGIYSDKQYSLNIKEDKTFARRLVYADNSTYSDYGSWEINDNHLTLNSTKSSSNEVYKLQANSGTSMGIYQKQTWRLLPDAVIDTLSDEYFDAHSQMLFDNYAKDVELNMHFFFKRVE